MDVTSDLKAYIYKEAIGLPMSTFYRTPFHMLQSLSQLPFGNSVYVISDSQYQEIKQREAQKEIDLLTKRAVSYRETADLIEKEIEQLRTEAGLLPASTDEPSEK